MRAKYDDVDQCACAALSVCGDASALARFGVAAKSDLSLKETL